MMKNHEYSSRNSITQHKNTSNSIKCFYRRQLRWRR